MCLVEVSTSRIYASYLLGNERICDQSPGDPKPSCRTMVGLDLHVLVNKQAIGEEKVAMYVPRPSWRSKPSKNTFWASSGLFPMLISSYLGRKPGSMRSIAPRPLGASPMPALPGVRRKNLCNISERVRIGSSLPNDRIFFCFFEEREGHTFFVQPHGQCEAANTSTYR
jgi:hypothetical protein